MKKFVLSLIFVLSLSSVSNADDLKTLKEKKLRVAEKGLAMSSAELNAGIGFYHRLLTWHKRVLSARLALAKDNKARLKCLNSYVASLETLHKDIEKQIAAGASTRSDLLEVQFHLIEAKIDLAKFKKTLKK